MGDVVEVTVDDDATVGDRTTLEDDEEATEVVDESGEAGGVGVSK